MASELAFRAQLILREQRELYDYWRRCAGARSMPSRDDIDPTAIPHLLPGVSLLDAEGGLDAIRYRLAGTRVRQIYGFEVTGRTVFDFDLQDKREYWRAAYHQVLSAQLPMQGAVRGPLALREHLLLFWLRLPLGDDRGKVAKILGYDAAMPSSFAWSHRGASAQEDASQASASAGRRFNKR